MTKKISWKDRAMGAANGPALTTTLEVNAVPRALQEESQADPSHNQDSSGISSKPKTGPGAYMAFMERESSIASENIALRKQLSQWDTATPALLLDPKLVKHSRWANRLAVSFDAPEFEQFKAEIQNAGGNIQPIKVRPVAEADENSPSFEIIFGHRRHRACLELGLPVLSLVEPATDLELFAAMDRENRLREDLRPYEQGIMYARALDEGLYSSMRKMAEALGVEQGTVSKATALARLPATVLSAFSSPLDLQYRWATDLTRALQKNTKAVLAVAQVIHGESPRPLAAQVLKRLLAAVDDSRGIISHKAPVILTGSAGQGAEIQVNAKKQTMTITLTHLAPERLAQVKKTIQQLIS